MTRGKAEDAGGLTPAKDDNAAPYHFDRRTLPIFKCVDYIRGLLHGSPLCRLFRASVRLAPTRRGQGAFLMRFPKRPTKSKEKEVLWPMMTFLTYLVSGISLGSVYAIIALGYTMVYGIAKMLNFAHGDVIMVGAYVSFCTTSYLHLPAWVSVVLAVAVCTALGVVIEGLAYRPLRQAGSLAVLITAIGVSYFLQNAAQLIWTSNTKVFTSVVGLPAVKLFGGRLTITGEAIVTVLACLLIMAGLTAFTNGTKMGKAMRACSEDKAAAQLMGINVNATISMTFAIGSALAAIAGVLLCSSYNTLIPTAGAMPGIKAFTAAVFGGIGSIPGALLGGLLLGIIEIFASGYLSSELSLAIVFGVLIVVLLVKPSGLLGKYVPEKV